jgi:predicted phosphodiesterase
MKKLLFACVWLFTVSVTSLSTAENLKVGGTVFEDADGDGALGAKEKPLARVVVSDGVTATQTNEQGAYEIRTATGRILFVSVPGTHHAAENRFWQSLDKTHLPGSRVDFPLLANPDIVDQRFTFVFLTDTHVGHGRNAREGAAKAYAFIAALKPPLVIHGGDIVFDALAVSDEENAAEQFDYYAESLLPMINAPFYHVLGNHDVFGWERSIARKSSLYGKEMYRKYFGPTYYSFNYAHCHFVILDSIARTEDRSEPTYYGVVDKVQLEWLRHDLAAIGPRQPVILVSHIPSINALASFFGVRSELVTSPSGDKVPKHQISNLQELLLVLKGHNLRLVLGGHYHNYEEVHWKDNDRDVLFVVGGSVCGEWWKGDRTIGVSSWPEGYTVVNVVGDRFDLTYVPYGWQGTQE